MFAAPGQLGRGIGKAYSAVGSPVAATYSIQFDADSGNYATIASAPDMFTGTLITMWTKNPQPSGYPYTQPNKSPFTIFGSDWHIWAITGNMATATTDASHSGYNANITLWGGMGDKLGFILDTTPEAQSIDWVFNAWQFIFSGVTASDTLTMRQWVRFGFNSPFVYKEDSMTVAAIRTAISDPAWVPSGATLIEFGRDSVATGELFNMTRIKVYQQAAKPTEAELSAIMVQTAADTSAWTDIPCEWVSGAPDIADVSGNGRDLTEAGTLAQGLDSSGANWDGRPYIRQTTDVGTGVGSASFTATFPSNTVLGNHIILEGAAASIATPTLSDDQANSYTTRAISVFYSYYYDFPYVAYAEVTTAGATIVQIAGLDGPQAAKIRGYEWVGLSTTTTEDFNASETTPAEPLTITAGSTSIAGVICVSSIKAPTGLEDYCVYPAGWSIIQGTTAITGGAGGTGLQCRKRFSAAGTHSVTWPDQVGAHPMIGVLVGFRPA